MTQLYRRLKNHAQKVWAGRGNVPESPMGGGQSNCPSANPCWASVLTYPIQIPVENSVPSSSVGRKTFKFQPSLNGCRSLVNTNPLAAEDKIATNRPAKCTHPVCQSRLRKAKIKCFFCDQCPHLTPQMSYYTCCQSYLCVSCRMKIERKPDHYCLLTGRLSEPCPLCQVPITHVTSITSPTRLTH